MDKKKLDLPLYEYFWKTKKIHKWLGEITEELLILLSLYESSMETSFQSFYFLSQFINSLCLFFFAFCVLLKIKTKTKFHIISHIDFLVQKILQNQDL